MIKYLEVVFDVFRLKREFRIVIDLNDIDIMIHISKLRYIDTHFIYRYIDVNISKMLIVS